MTPTIRLAQPSLGKQEDRAGITLRFGLGHGVLGTRHIILVLRQQICITFLTLYKIQRIRIRLHQR